MSLCVDVQCFCFFFLWRVNARLHFLRQGGGVSTGGWWGEKSELSREGLGWFGGSRSTGCTGRAGGRAAATIYSWVHPE